jgi:hypothetical protein
MKYGYLFYRTCKSVDSPKVNVNLGDVVQSLAVIDLYHEMGISDEDIIPVDRYDVSRFDASPYRKDGGIILPVNCYDGSYNKRYFNSSNFPVPEGITPVFTSIHFADEKMTSDEIDALRYYGPIGCRDECSVQMLGKEHINAYLSGCLTLTLPKRKPNGRQNKVFLIDVRPILRAKLPQHIADGAVELSNIHKYDSISGTDRVTVDEAERAVKVAVERYETLRDEARLVITSRLHIAAPCLAMGIPVILARDVWYDGRFSWIDKYLPLYHAGNIDSVDWDPTPPDIEEEKQLIKNMFFSALRFAETRTRVNDMYVSRKRQIALSDFDSGIKKEIERMDLPKDKPFNYVIWGVRLVYALSLIDSLSADYPNSVFLGGVDSYVTGNIEGKPIIKPDEIKNLPAGTIVFVPSSSAQKPAFELLGGDKSHPSVFIGFTPNRIDKFNF